jgi:mutator protein MutT
VGGVLIHDGRVLLIRRGKEPLYGRWLVPGGTVEHGEGLEDALVREMQEETGIEVRPLELLTVFDRIERRNGDVLYHYVIVDYLCGYVSGEAKAGSDALEVAWVAVADLPAFDLPPKALEVVGQAWDRSKERVSTVAPGGNPG